MKEKKEKSRDLSLLSLSRVKSGGAYSRVFIVLPTYSTPYITTSVHTNRYKAKGLARLPHS